MFALRQAQGDSPDDFRSEQKYFSQLILGTDLECMLQ